MSETSFTAQDHTFMARALSLAAEGGRLGEVPVGAVIVRDGKVLGEGYNCPISGHDPTAHAEIVALRDAAMREGNYRLPDTTLYVTLEPCTMCMGALIHARIANVIYAADEPRAGAVRSQLSLADAAHYNHRITVSAGLMAAQSAQLLKSFFAERRKKKS
ncbi:tRNA adenosine(34) deaminase TadA [Granulosicoccaceae sp. 1_MG-2023]|nr:tRNA adenosine(34) deaminase TadA [Granulosicoccaceae sp. 1_MG-2023]